MTDRNRVIIFFVFGIILFALFCCASIDLPAWGYYRGPYGDYISRLAVHERHATDAVNAINYDYRAFDTLGEEFILFTSVLGVMLLLRREEGEPNKNDHSKGFPSDKVHDLSPLSPTVRAVAVPVILLTILFGFYIGFHGQLTPGGGFQAGVILSSAPFLVYLTQNTDAFIRITSHPSIEFIEALGAASYALIGIASLLVGVPFLTNILPLGQTGDVFSAGTIAVISSCVGFEVTTAFVLVTYTYLQEIVSGHSPEQ